MSSFESIQSRYWIKISNGIRQFVVKLYLFFSCSNSRPHMLPYSISQTNSFRFIRLLLCVHVIMHVSMQCTLFHYLNSTASDNKHELVQVTLLLHIITHTKFQRVCLFIISKDKLLILKSLESTIILLYYNKT